MAACKNIKGEKMFGMAYRGFESKVIHGLDQPLVEDICQECDGCISLCPTGALNKPRKAGEAKQGVALFIKG